MQVFRISPRLCMYNQDHSRQSHIRNLIQSYYLTRPECFYPIHPLFFFHPNTSTCLTVEYTLHTSEKSLMQFRELNLFLYGSGSPYRKKIYQKLSKLWTIYAFQNKTHTAKVWWVFEPFNICMYLGILNCPLTLQLPTIKMCPYLPICVSIFFQNGPGQYYHSFG